MANFPYRRIGLLLVMASTAAIAAIVVPWGSLQDHSHWARIGWVPFVSQPIRRFDIVANTLLFMPLGAGVALAFHRPLATAASLALALSLSGEAVQIYTHSRFPSATDVVCNVVGAVAAALVVGRTLRRSAPVR